MPHDNQLAHTDHRPTDKKFPLILVANDVYSPFNVGGLFRLCDALGIEKLYLCGKSIIPPNAKIKKPRVLPKRMLLTNTMKMLQTLSPL